MSFNISYMIEAIDRFSPVIAKINNSLRKFQAKIQSSNEKLSRLKDKFSSIGKSLSLKVTTPLIALAGYSIKQAANFQTLTTQMRPYLGSLKKAGDFMNKLSAFTGKSPFHLKGMAANANALFAAHVKVKEIIPDLKKLGDISAQTSIPLDGLVRVFGQTSEFGKMKMSWLYRIPQLIPAITNVLHQAGIKGTVLDYTAAKGVLTFGLLRKAINDMDSKGGIAYHGMERQMKTIDGLFSTLYDNVERAAAKIGLFIWDTFGLTKVMQGAIEILTGFVAGFDKFTKLHPVISKLILGMLAFAAILGPVSLGIAGLIAAFTFLAASEALALWPITLIVGAIMLAVAGVTYLYNRFKLVRTVVKGIWEEQKFIVDELIKAVELAGELFDILYKISGLKEIFPLIGMIGGKGKAPAAPASPFGPGSANSLVDLFYPTKMPGSNKTDVTIHLDDPGNIVKKVTKKTGSSNTVHLGKNMQHLDVGWIGG